ncbi:hypothetical protein IWQ60_002501 [Tieghemiomyces parasiticus]|uniref:Uncharacterized protein n=1 Tax=Tieghemiomyces parasiticus TaxID=78921 RepID=A0A9W8E1K7_9FUNG|nr:hypothetical protein IWQ60_002501 [Tieghemiomyces parasiticus]
MQHSPSTGSASNRMSVADIHRLGTPPGHPRDLMTCSSDYEFCDDYTVVPISGSLAPQRPRHHPLPTLAKLSPRDEAVSLGSFATESIEPAAPNSPARPIREKPLPQPPSPGTPVPATRSAVSSPVMYRSSAYSGFRPPTQSLPSVSPVSPQRALPTPTGLDRSALATSVDLSLPTPSPPMPAAAVDTPYDLLPPPPFTDCSSDGGHDGPTGPRRPRKYSEGNIRDIPKLRNSYRGVSGSVPVLAADYLDVCEPLPAARSSPPSPADTISASVPVLPLVGDSRPTLTTRHSHPAAFSRPALPPSRRSFLLSDEKYPASLSSPGHLRDEAWLEAALGVFDVPPPPSRRSVSAVSGYVLAQPPKRQSSTSFAGPTASTASFARSLLPSVSEDTVAAPHSGSSAAPCAAPYFSMGLTSFVSGRPLARPYHWLFDPKLTRYITAAIVFLAVAFVVGTVYGGACFSYACHQHGLCSRGFDAGRPFCKPLGIEGSTALLAVGVVSGIVLAVGLYRRRVVGRKLAAKLQRYSHCRCKGVV